MLDMRYGRSVRKDCLMDMVDVKITRASKDKVSKSMGSDTNIRSVEEVTRAVGH